MVVSLGCSLLILIAYTLEAEGGEQGRVLFTAKDCHFRDLLTTPRAEKGKNCIHLTASRKALRLHSEHGTAIWHGPIFQIAADHCLYLSAQLGLLLPNDFVAR